MRSSGGVADFDDAAAHPAVALVSGPAAGVVGAAKVAREAGLENAIAFDMGGTSTDVCLIESGAAARRAERDVGSLPVRLPTVDLHTVGAGGNVETSSRIVDVVFAAFARAIPVSAQGQGTMNNVTLGNERFTYCETISGGQGACPEADGPSGVHVAMSNTLTTPVEALELAYPLRVERYGLRLGSGGRGRHRGGDGVVRELRVLEDCRLSILSERRTRAPRGAAGGEDAAPGRNLLNGRELPAGATVDLHAGYVVTIEMPGGGAHGG